jgi:hypothetical protein
MYGNVGEEDNFYANASEARRSRAVKTAELLMSAMLRNRSDVSKTTIKQIQPSRVFLKEDQPERCAVQSISGIIIRTLFLTLNMQGRIPQHFSNNVCI